MRGLTETKIKNLTTPGRYADSITGLYLVVRAGTTGTLRKNWIQRLTINYRQHDLGLGSWPDTSLDMARRKAMDNRRKRAEGENVLTHRRQTTAPTFEHAAAKVIAMNEGTWKDSGKSAKLWSATLRDYAFPFIGSKRVSAITADDVLAVLTPIWTEKHETARRVKSRVSQILRWAKAKGYRQDDPTDAVKMVLPKADKLKSNFKALHPSDVSAAIATVNASKAHPSTKRCFEFLVLTATRSQEARLATWDEIDTDAKVWTIPADRTKTGKEHRVPLSPRALALLDDAKQSATSTLVFPSPTGKILSDSTISKTVRENAIQGVPHGIARASFRTWCAERNVSKEIAEACLAHALQGVEASYQRSDLFRQRARVMHQWADYLTNAKGDVVSLRA